jgi:hypothetical protein
MESANQNIVSLADFKKAREQLDLKDIEPFIKYEQNLLRKLDQDISAHLKQRRRLIETEKLRTELAAINGRLIEIADCLEDESVHETNPQRAETIEKFRKLNAQLLTRSEVTRKVLVDDMANSRFYEQRWLLDPVKFVALVVMAPVGITTFIEKFITNKDQIGVHVGETTVALGLYLAFKSQADRAVGRAYRSVKQAPAKLRTLAAASALEISVRAKPVNEIEPTFPKERYGYQQTMCVLKR